MRVEIDAGNSRIKWRICLDQIVESRGVCPSKDIEVFLKVLDQIPSIEKYTLLQYPTRVFSIE